MNILRHFRGTITAVCAMVVVICFFLPWIKVHFTAAAALKDLIGGDNSASMLTTSGYEVPQMANGSTAKVFITVFGMFFSNIENADKKSYLVWAVPLLAVLLAILSRTFRGKWIASAVIGAIGAGIAIGATVKILMTDLSGLVVRVEICPALWAIFLAYGIIGLVHLLSINPERRNRTI